MDHNTKEQQASNISKTKALPLSLPIFKSRGDAFVQLYNHIKEYGIPYDNTKAIFDVQFGIVNTQIEDFPEWRNYSRVYEEDEFEYYLYHNQNRNTGIMAKYRLWRQITDGTGRNWNNYGWHIMMNNQLEKAIDEINKNIYSRRAMVTLFDRKYEDYKHDRPCTSTVSWYILDKTLYTTVHMRSNDLWYGFCYDSKWWGWVSKELVLPALVHEDIQLGTVTWNVTNLHLYINNIKF